MPIDPDEESLPSSPLPTAKPSPFAANPVAASPAAGLAWGVCGVLHEAGELAAHPGARGVTRFVADGVRYAPPPFRDGVWKATPGQADSYQLPWADNPAQARTLASFRLEIDDAARTGRLRKGTDPLLDELNHLTTKLCGMTEALHRSRWSLGLIQPANVILKTTPDGPEPMLADLGFTWKGSYGPPPWDASPGKPAWLEGAGTDWLYDVAAVRRQFADPAETAFPPAEPIADVRVLGRLFAWLLTGSREAEVRAPARSTAPELWRILAAAADGQIATVREFRDHLRDNPPSEHFTDPVVLAVPPPPPAMAKKSGSATLIPLLGVGLLALIAAGAGGAYFAGLFDGPKETTSIAATERQKEVTPPTVPKEKPPETPVVVPAEYGAIMDDLIGALKKKDGKAAGEKLLAAEKLGKLPAKEAAERDKQRDEFLNLWNNDYQDIKKIFAKNPGEKINLIERAKALQARLTRLTDSFPTSATNAILESKEKQCLNFAKELLRDLGYSASSQPQP